MSEKTHEPSAQRLREARKKGQIPKSRLLGAAAVSLGAMIGVLSVGDRLAAELVGYAHRIFSLQELRPEAALADGLHVLSLGALPALVGAFIGALLVGVSSAGLMLNVGHVAPQLERVDPMAGFKKLFSPSQLVELGKGLAVAIIVLVIAWGDVKAAAPVAFKAVGAQGAAPILALIAVLEPLLLKVCLVLALLGVVDGWLARRKLRKELMMTHEEVKQEHKSSEGDPHHKAQRKALHKQLAQGGRARGVQKATAVVVNPTHIAVALRFDESECDAPYIVARGREEDALEIRKQARALGIPIVKDIPLARSLVHYDLGDEVPEELYKAAAAVLKVALDETRNGDARPQGETL
jgi:type III secretion protein U